MAAPNSTTTGSPRFSKSDVTVIFVLGGPGSGKGTQSASLVRDYGFHHLSAGDLLRAEQAREGSEFGELIKSYIREGKIVPMEITVGLLRNAMTGIIEGDKEKYAGGEDGKKETPRFLIDGFPRKMDQAVFFEESVCVSTGTLFLDCPEETMLQRLLKRGETSGRDDDNIESIKKRFNVFKEQSMPVVEHFRKQDKVLEVSSVGPVEEVYQRIREGLSRFGIQPKA